MVNTLKVAVAEFSNDNCSRMAAALAYYTAFSLAPLLILIITLCGFIWAPSEIQGALETEIKNVIGKDGAAQVKSMLENATKPDKGVLASVLSGIMLFIGATGVVGQLQSALNEAWEVKPAPDEGGYWNFISKRILSFGMICGVAFLLLVSLVINSALAAAGGVIASSLPAGISETALKVINIGAAVLIISILFAVMFKYLPDAEIQWSDVAVGAVLTAVLFVIGKFAIGAYLGSSNMESTYGAAGSFVLIMVWIYYSAMIFLFGAEFTQVWAKQRGTGIKPEEGAVRVVEKTENVSGG